MALITYVIIWQQLDKQVSSSRIGENILVQKNDLMQLVVLLNVR